MPRGATAFRISTRGESFHVSLTHGLNLHTRFRQVPTFGRDTIRRFANNVSEMKKLAGRDFEDILQVSPILIIFLSPNRSISITPTVHNSRH